jgi:hypothetical protein
MRRIRFAAKEEIQAVNKRVVRATLEELYPDSTA